MKMEIVKNNYKSGIPINSAQPLSVCVIDHNPANMTWNGAIILVLNNHYFVLLDYGTSTFNRDMFPLGHYDNFYTNVRVVPIKSQLVLEY